MPILVRGAYVITGEPCYDPAWVEAIADVHIRAPLPDDSLMQELAARSRPAILAVKQVVNGLEMYS